MKALEPAASRERNASRSIMVGNMFVVVVVVVVCSSSEILLDFMSDGSIRPCGSFSLQSSHACLSREIRCQ